MGGGSIGTKMKRFRHLERRVLGRHSDLWKHPPDNRESFSIKLFIISAAIDRSGAAALRRGDQFYVSANTAVHAARSGHPFRTVLEGECPETAVIPRVLILPFVRHVQDILFEQF